MLLPNPVRWAWALGIAVLVIAVPIVFYRWDYTHHKRFREVEAGVLYRSGQMTVGGFADAIRRYQIRTVVNLQNEFEDPSIRTRFLAKDGVPESEMCRRLGVQYIFLPPDLLPVHQVPERRPEAIDRFLAIMDDPNNYPVLIHCKAGLHRTGILAAVYRMEYDGWSWPAALRELRRNGFDRFASSSANVYIEEYIQTFRPGLRHPLQNALAP